MKNACEFDERQLLLRGNVFQHTTVLLFVLLLANGLLKSEGVSWAPPFYENLLMMWAAIDWAIIEYALRGITPRGRSQHWIYWMDLLCGLVLLALSLTHVADGAPLVQGAALTQEGAHLAIAIFILLGAVFFLAKRLWDNHKSQLADED